MDDISRGQALHQLQQAIVLVLELARRLGVLPQEQRPAPTPLYDKPRPLFLREAARDARCGEHTLRRAIAAGTLAARRVSGKLRIEPDELERWAAQREAGVSASPSVDKPAPKSAPQAKSGKQEGKHLRVVKSPKSVQASPRATTAAEEMIADAVIVGVPRQAELPWTE